MHNRAGGQGTATGGAQRTLEPHGRAALRVDEETDRGRVQRGTTGMRTLGNVLPTNVDAGNASLLGRLSRSKATGRRSLMGLWFTVCG